MPYPVVLPAIIASYFNVLHVGIQTFVLGLLTLVYVSEAIEIEQQGLRLAPEKPKAIEIPEELEKTFGAQPDLEEAFNKLSPGKQKEYCEYIASAKQEATRISRLEKCMPLILNGSGLNDKYRKNC